MYCKYCGKQIDEDSLFCAACGKALSDGERPSAVVTTKKGKKRVSGAFLLRPRSILLLLLAVGCMVPLAFGEYHRLVTMNGALDVYYWLSAAPVLLSVFFLYQVIGAPVVAEEKTRREQGEGSVDLTTLRSEMLSFCCLAVGILAFAIAGAIRALF